MQNIKLNDYFEVYGIVYKVIAFSTHGMDHKTVFGLDVSAIPGVEEKLFNEKYLNNNSHDIKSLNINSDYWNKSIRFCTFCSCEIAKIYTKGCAECRRSLLNSDNI